MPDSQRIALSEDLTIYHALEQKQMLLEALANTDVLELDLSHVGEMDTAGLQLLILLKKEAQTAGKRVSIVAHSQAVRSVIDFCNVATEFGDLVPAPYSSVSGRFVQRVPKSLHRQLVDEAKSEGVSLNTLVVSLVAEGLGRRVSKASLTSRSSGRATKRRAA